MKKGFSLIELLVVIAIIALLAGILFPVFSAAKARARQATCATNLAELGMSISMYCADNDMRMIPCVSFCNFTKQNEDGIGAGDSMLVGYSLGGYTLNDCWAWSTILYPYVKNKNTFYCPASLYEPGQDMNGVSASTYNTGYAINVNVTGGSNKSVVYSGSNISRVCPPLVRQFKDPHNTYLVADGASCGLFGTPVNGTITGSNCYIPGSYDSKESAEADGITGDAVEDAMERHGHGDVMMLFADYHADLVNATSLRNDVLNNNTVGSNGNL